MPGLTGGGGRWSGQNASQLRLTGALAVPGMRGTPGHCELRVSVEQGVDIPGGNYQIAQ